MQQPLIIVIILLVLLVTGYVFFFAGDREEMEEVMEASDTMMDDHEVMEEEDMMESDEAMMEDEAMLEEDGTMMEEISFEGTVLAGDKAPLLDFNQADYKKALASDKSIVLYFYATWCPICKEELPKLEQAFDELDTDKIVGFRVNFNDSDTDDFEKSLAREFGVAYQHTKVFLKGDERVLKAPDSWDVDRYRKEFATLLEG